MKLQTRRGALICSAGLAVVISSPAFATGTETVAGTTIQNIAYVDYTIGGIAQSQQASNTNTFVVDRKINFTVAEVGDTTTLVSPNQSQAVTTFQVTNLSNTVIDIGLFASQLSGGTATHGGTDTFDATNVKIYVDTNGDGTYTPGVDQQTAYIDELAIDGTITVFVVADIPIGLSSGDVAGVELTGVARAGGASGVEGAVLASTIGGNTAGVDIVLADTGQNGIESDQDDYTILAAAINAVKYSRVVADPINGSNNPKMIPGATVEYCIAVTNGGGATASNVVVTDAVPANTTFYGSFGVKTDGTGVAGETCAVGPGAGSFNGTIVTGPLSPLATGETRTVVFQVTID